MTDQLSKLLTRWRKDSEIYAKQVDEARKAGTPHEQMMAVSQTLKACALEVEKILRENV